MMRDRRIVSIPLTVLLSIACQSGIADLALGGPPTNYEQYFIELINRDRADPAAAAAS